MTASHLPVPGVIVVAERSLHDMLVGQEIAWNVQERQSSISGMWDALSGGRLDQHSRILVFSDSLLDGTNGDLPELEQTARAVVAMANAGARVFVAVWRPEMLPRFEGLVSAAAAAQGLGERATAFTILPAGENGRAVLDALRDELGGEVGFPDDWSGAVDAALFREDGGRPSIWSSGPLPSQPPEVELPSTPELNIVRTLPTAEPPAVLAADAEETEDEAASEAETEPESAIEPEQSAPSGSGGDQLLEEIEEIESLHVEEFVEADAAEGYVDDESQGVEPTVAPDLPAAGSDHAVAEPVTDVDEAGWGRPPLPPISLGGTDDSTGARSAAEYPPSASIELLNRPVRPGQVTITVTSSKGGSGKSTASVLLGGSIARASREAGKQLSVVVVDLDTRDGQVASLIGKFMPTALNIRVQPHWDEDCIASNLVHAEGLGIDTLLAPIRPRTAETVGPEFYRTIIRSLKRMYDVVIMDTSVQYLDPLIADVALVEADEVLFVTTLASTAVQGMARALREITAPEDESGLGVPREKIGIIVNQSVANVGMERDQVLAAGLGVPVVGVIPLATKDVLTATNRQRLFALLDHPLLGPSYNQLARACLPSRVLAEWHSTGAGSRGSDGPTLASVTPINAAGGEPIDDVAEGGRRRGLFGR